MCYSLDKPLKFMVYCQRERQRNMALTFSNEKVTKIIYYNTQSNWGIFAIPDRKQVPEIQGNPDICVTGNFEGIYEGCKIDFTAEITEHPKYGKQLQLQHYKVPVSYTHLTLPTILLV